MLIILTILFAVNTTNAMEIGYVEETPNIRAYTTKDYEYISSTNDVDLYMSFKQIYKIQTENQNDSIRTAPIRFDIKTNSNEFSKDHVIVEYQAFNCITKENLSFLVLLFINGEFIGSQLSDNVWEKTDVGTNGRLVNDLACLVVLKDILNNEDVVEFVFKYNETDSIRYFMDDEDVSSFQDALTKRAYPEFLKMYEKINGTK